MRNAHKLGLGLIATFVAGSLLLFSGQRGHTQVPAKAKSVAVDLSKPFDHGSHLKLLRKKGDKLMGCADCHEQKVTAANKGFPICEDARMPFPSHNKCTGCHPKAFWTRPLQICTNCHLENTFTKQPPLKPQTTANAPLRTKFDHKLHLSDSGRVKKRFKFEKDCSFCHTFSDGGKKVEFPGHAQCCDCHTKENVEPNINDCAGCHARPKWQKAPKSKIKKFSHEDHTLDPLTGASVDCERCHSAVKEATRVKDIAKPAMATCVECHQGEVAFDYTNCLKCHGDDITKMPVPESHSAALPKK